MTATLTLEFGSGSQSTLDLLRGFGAGAIIGGEKGMARAAVAIENRAITAHLQGQTVAKRSTTLLRSLVAGVRRGRRGLPEGFVGVRRDSPAAKYAAIIHEGTVGKGGRFPDIVPVRAKALAVPLRAAMDSKGIPIYSGPRDPELANQLFLIRRSSRPPLLARSLGGSSIEPLFILLKKVAIKPRPFLTLAAREISASGQLGKIMSRAIAREVAKRRGRS